jgi:hypothetical protein
MLKWMNDVRQMSGQTEHETERKRGYTEAATVALIHGDKDATAVSQLSEIHHSDLLLADRNRFPSISTSGLQHGVPRARLVHVLQQVTRSVGRYYAVGAHCKTCSHSYEM